MALDTKALDASVAKWKNKSPNIAASFEEVKKLLAQLDTRLAKVEGGATVPPPVEPPPVEPPPVEPPPTSGGILEFSGVLSGSTFVQQVNAAPAGKLTVRPKAGQTTYEVTGDFHIGRANLTVQGMVTKGDVRFEPTADNLVIENCKMRQWYVMDGGLDGLIMRNNVFDGEALVAQNWMYGATHFKILNNTFRNFHYGPNESAHSEGIFCAARNQYGIIQGNTFTDNGTTGHIFFSWWGGTSGVDHPKNIAVKGNTFIRSLNGYYHIQFREEVPASAGIDIDTDNVKGASISGYDTQLTSHVQPAPCDPWPPW